jgi:hypothetical protein
MPSRKNKYDLNLGRIKPLVADHRCGRLLHDDLQRIFWNFSWKQIDLKAPSSRSLLVQSGQLETGVAVQV